MWWLSFYSAEKQFVLMDFFRVCTSVSFNFKKCFQAIAPLIPNGNVINSSHWWKFSMMIFKSWKKSLSKNFFKLSKDLFFFFKYMSSRRDSHEFLKINEKNQKCSGWQSPIYCLRLLWCIIALPEKLFVHNKAWYPLFITCYNPVFPSL